VITRRKEVSQRWRRRQQRRTGREHGIVRKEPLREKQILMKCLLRWQRGRSGMYQLRKLNKMIRRLSLRWKTRRNMKSRSRKRLKLTRLAKEKGSKKVRKSLLKLRRTQSSQPKKCRNFGRSPRSWMRVKKRKKLLKSHTSQDRSRRRKLVEQHEDVGGGLPRASHLPQSSSMCSPREARTKRSPGRTTLCSKSTWTLKKRINRSKFWTSKPSR